MPTPHRAQPSPEPPAAPGGGYLATAARTAIRLLGRGDEGEFTARARESVALHRPWLFPPATPERFAYYVDRLEEPERAGFVVCERATGQLAGYVTINNIVGGAFQCGALGYGAFAHAAGRGLLGEGLGLVVDHAFGPLGLHRLEANIQPGNARSIALARRTGFRREGLSPDFLYVDGAWRDHERWAITSDMPRPWADQGTVGP
ncbi:GNAT family N-acetyltransferase [Streptomyces sp. NPDC057702]|uniref:GNAT family N-acetyltransferase n=1 Tax=unclassified Streptomyces TaxID=2593676 RepID=UPI0036AFEED5